MLFENRDTAEILTFELGAQAFALPVMQVQEVLLAQKVMPVPLAPDVLRGLFSLRGQIVSAVSLRHIFNMEILADREPQNILVNDDGELFALQVDEVGEVVEVHRDQFDATPANMDRQFRSYATGIIRSGKKLRLLLDVKQILHIQKN